MRDPKNARTARIASREVPASCPPPPAWAALTPETGALAEVKEVTVTNGTRRIVIEVPTADGTASEPDPGCPLSLIARALALAEEEGCFLPVEGASAAAGVLLEPLSARESDVLGLVAQGFTNQEVADRLFITPGTVKSHLHSAFGKLSARTRTRAVSRARELNLL